MDKSITTQNDHGSPAKSTNGGSPAQSYGQGKPTQKTQPPRKKGEASK